MSNPVAVSIVKSAGLLIAVAALATLHLACCCCCCGPPDPTAGFQTNDDFDRIYEELSDNSNAGSTAFGASCDDTASLSRCDEYTEGSMSLLGEDFYRSMCELGDGKWSKSRCPTADLVGGCADGAGSTTFHYSTGVNAWTVESSKSECDLWGSTWKDPATLVPAGPPQAHDGEDVGAEP